MEPIYKIYSRKRLRLGFLNNNNSTRLNRFKKKVKKSLPFSISICIGLAICYVIWNSVNPVFEALCRDEAKVIATQITNEETSKIMDKYDYDTFFTIEKDEEGNIQMISANVLKINQIISDIALEIQNSLRDSNNSKIYIALGSATGIRLIAGMGPKIPVSISTVGNVETNLKSEFIAQGVNQTLHRVYLEIQSNVSILTPTSTIDESIYNQVLILENVIVGEIPSSYYDFDGIDSGSQALEVVE